MNSAPSQSAEPPAFGWVSRINWRSAVTAFPDLVIAGVFLATWIRPFTFGLPTVEYAMLTMLLEFVIVHSSAFMGAAVVSRGPVLGRGAVILGFALFYSLFVGGFAIGFGTWWPLVAFWSLTFNRLLGVLIGDAVEGQEAKYVMAGWALSAMYYLGGAFFTTFVPLPELGITSGVRAQLDLPGEGLWIDQPHRVIAFGVLYYGLSATGELLGWAKSESFLKGGAKLGSSELSD